MTWFYIYIYASPFFGLVYWLKFLVDLNDQLDTVDSNPLTMLTTDAFPSEQRQCGTRYPSELRSGIYIVTSEF